VNWRVVILFSNRGESLQIRIFSPLAVLIFTAGQLTAQAPAAVTVVKAGRLLATFAPFASLLLFNKKQCRGRLRNANRP
jgi:hypothetical protein